MVQFCIDDEEEHKFWRVFKRMLQETFNDIEKYYQDAYKSKELGTVLFEQQLFPIYKVLERDLFIKAYYEIMEGEKTLGSIPAYLKILYAIFGGGANIKITQQPLVLAIDIIAPIQNFIIWVTKDNKEVVDKEGRNIAFKSILAEVTNRDLIQILKAITNAGTYIEFTLNDAQVVDLTQLKGYGIMGEDTFAVQFVNFQVPNTYNLLNSVGIEEDQVTDCSFTMYAPQALKIYKAIIDGDNLENCIVNIYVGDSEETLNKVMTFEEVTPELEINQIVSFFKYIKFEILVSGKITLRKIDFEMWRNGNVIMPPETIEEEKPKTIQIDFTNVSNDSADDLYLSEEYVNYVGEGRLIDLFKKVVPEVVLGASAILGIKFIEETTINSISFSCSADAQVIYRVQIGEENIQTTDEEIEINKKISAGGTMFFRIMVGASTDIVVHEININATREV